jgi:hypothetical protein
LQPFCNPNLVFQPFLGVCTNPMSVPPFTL